MLNMKYYCFCGQKLVAENNLNKIFIKLEEKFVVKNKMIYCLVLDGKNVDKYVISSFCNDFKVLRKLGQKTALNLGINYFDILDSSQYHKILNFCPDDFDSKDLWNFLFNQNRIIIEKQPFYWKRIDKNEQCSLDYQENYSNASLSSNITIKSVKNVSSISLNLSKNLSYDQGQEAVISFNQLQNQLNILSQQIKAIKSLKNNQPL